MTKDEALKLALEALKDIHPGNMTPMAEEYWNKAIGALKEALAQPEQEPIGYFTVNDYDNWEQIDGTSGKPLYERPAAQPAYRAVKTYHDNKPWYVAQPEPVQEPLSWKNAAIRLGEELSSVGPDGYYDMAPEKWLDWAMAQQPQGKNSLLTAQREWVGLTPKEVAEIVIYPMNKTADLVRMIESKLRSKNEHV